VKSGIAAVILAAGASTRLGEPKQLLRHEGSTFIENCINKALQANCVPVVVVLGANSEKIIPKVADYPVEIVINGDWSMGMGTSIAVGIKRIENYKEVEAAILMVCDQPYVSKKLLENLVDKYTFDTTIVACSYRETIGVPALFDRSHFAELVLLSGNEGAKKIIQSHLNKLVTVSFEKGSFDIDTQEDYKKLSGI
jgi:molybdenum cofactor cytidylyltransferase